MSKTPSCSKRISQISDWAKMHNIKIKHAYVSLREWMELYDFQVQHRISGVLQLDGVKVKIRAAPES